jgi:hypothetical protein
LEKQEEVGSAETNAEELGCSGGKLMNSVDIGGVKRWGCATGELIMISLNTAKSTFAKKIICSLEV